MKLADIYFKARDQFYVELAHAIKAYPEKTYTELAVEFSCSIATVVRVAKEYNLTRSHGRKAAAKLTASQAAAEVEVVGG